MATTPDSSLRGFAGAISTGRPVAISAASSNSIATGSPSRARPTTSRSAARPCAASHVGSSPVSMRHSAEGSAVDGSAETRRRSRSQKSRNASSAFFCRLATSCSSVSRIWPKPMPPPVSADAMAVSVSCTSIRTWRNSRCAGNRRATVSAVAKTGSSVWAPVAGTRTYLDMAGSSDTEPDVTKRQLCSLIWIKRPLPARHVDSLDQA